MRGCSSARCAQSSQYLLPSSALTIRICQGRGSREVMALLAYHNITPGACTCAAAHFSTHARRLISHAHPQTLAHITGLNAIAKQPSVLNSQRLHMNQLQSDCFDSIPSPPPFPFRPTPLSLSCSDAKVQAVHEPSNAIVSATPHRPTPRKAFRRCPAMVWMDHCTKGRHRHRQITPKKEVLASFISSEEGM